ncbi:MAG: winged helix-turn-helix domain-containing protein [Anaerolineae bacterium]|nr:winged helix-turn-helix domain-containing protein [Anaerolineae bacterium]
MQPLVFIDQIEPAIALFKPLRIQLLQLMAQPQTCADLSHAVGQTPQKVYYHVKVLQQAGLVEKVSEQRVRGIMEGYYQAKARAYWLSPRLVGLIGGKRQSQDQMSLSFLLGLAEELQLDIGSLIQQTSPELPSMGLSAQIELPSPALRAAFMQDVQTAFQALAAKYGRTGSAPTTPDSPETFRIMLACYPKPAADAV